MSAWSVANLICENRTQPRRKGNGPRKNLGRFVTLLIAQDQSIHLRVFLVIPIERDTVDL